MSYTPEQRRQHARALGLPDDPEAADWLMAMTPGEYHAQRAKVSRVLAQRITLRKQLSKRMTPHQKWEYRHLTLGAIRRLLDQQGSRTPARVPPAAGRAREGRSSRRQRSSRAGPGSDSDPSPADPAAAVA